MAIAAASGYGSLPNNAWSPVIYAKKVQLALRKASVIDAVTNTDYMNEISNYGDSVKIVREPSISITPYERGLSLTTQNIVDSDFTMTIDQANYYQFAVDDIEENFSHQNWQQLASDQAGYKLRDAYDAEVLGYMSGWKTPSSWARNTTTSGSVANAAAGTDELLASNKLSIVDFSGTDIGGSGEVTSIPIAAGGGAGGITPPLAILNRIARLMDQANVDSEERWVCCDSVFAEVLMDESSKLISSDFGGGDELRNGRLPGMLRGFKIYKSNNLPYLSGGAGVSASAGSETNFGVLVAGHASCVATAEQIAKTETFRSPNSFSDVVRGLQLYGRKILRPEGLFTANYNLA